MGGTSDAQWTSGTWEHRPEHLMAYLQPHTPLRLNLHNNEVCTSIQLFNNPSLQDGLVLGTKGYAVVDQRRRLIPPCDESPTIELTISKSPTIVAADRHPDWG